MKAKGLEFVACNLCGRSETELLFEAPVRSYRAGVFAQDVWNVVRCRHCALIYVNPRIDDEARDYFYSFQNPGDRAAVDRRFLTAIRRREPLWNRYLRILATVGPTGKLLDVGCGPGDFLVAARAHGYDAAGQEVSELFLDHARRVHGLDVHGGFLEELEFPAASFDVVTAFDVIEHHPDPKGLAREMRRLLRPGGLAMLSTHDIGNWFARRYGVNWRYLHPISHITYFTRDTLQRLLADAGFETVRVGGFHTIDASRSHELRNWILQGAKLITVRGAILWLYKPLASRLSPLRRWRVPLGRRRLDHETLLALAGPQVAMNDGMVVVARAV